MSEPSRALVKITNLRSLEREKGDFSGSSRFPNRYIWKELGLLGD